MASATKPREGIVWSDTRLVEECLKGNEEAWAALIDKYKRLVYSVPVRWGFSAEDAGDIFQSVVAELLSHLNTLREPKALPAWLLQVSVQKCQRWRQQQIRDTAPEGSEAAAEAIEADTPELLAEQASREQMLRDAVAAVPPRCRELIRMLFFENTPRPYAEVAAELGLATGSVGFIRQRCLERLRRYLEEAGFR